VYENGVRVAGPLFSALSVAHREPGAPTRVGFSLPKALGNAVARNRIRRRLRESVRLEMAEEATGFDIVFHPRKSALTASWDELRREVRKVFARCKPS